MRAELFIAKPYAPHIFNVVAEIGAAFLTVALILGRVA